MPAAPRQCAKRGRDGAGSAQESARAFWWSVGAFFEAIVAGGLDPGFGTKQLAARLDLQIRRVVEGSVKVAARLRREVLYYVAVSAPVTSTVAAVQRSYGLPGSFLPPRC
jgi:chemosensory pili system protein ChpA (sensor histidine kinase/response regulator)